ncbi:MAG: 6,7-dimethyl-8-ribityllumazine synthase [Thermoflavifilum sp.]|nr:6,7-dimethyl-8-ribityllumazine synthase [Thermoflavifilum sp.]
MSIHNERFLDPASIPIVEEGVVGIVHTEWNAFIVDELVRGCERMLVQHGVIDIEKMQVPGAFELPYGCRQVFERFQPEAIIALGCVIRGETPHFEYVCQAVTQGIGALNVVLPAPIIFGVLTVNSVDQAKARAGGSHGHKGEEAAIAALKLIHQKRQWQR